MTLAPPQWAMNRAWDEDSLGRADYEKLCTAEGARQLPDWVDENLISASAGSYDREIIDRLTYEYRTMQRNFIVSKVARRAMEIDHYARLKEQIRRLGEESGRALRIVAKLRELQKDGRKTARITDLLNGDHQ